MKFRLLFGLALLGLSQSQAIGQTSPMTTDVLGQHNLTASSGSRVSTQGAMGCTFCHAPHSGVGGNTPLWNQVLSQQTYIPYASTTYHQQGNTQPPLGQSTSLCLSCHDGTVAVGQTQAYGQLRTQGKLGPADILGPNMSSSHPFSLMTPMKDSPNLVASLVGQHKTADSSGAVKLINGNVECASCHDPHVQSIDKIAQNFLVRDSSAGQMCLACHDPNRVVQGQVNLLTGWTGSIHATATNQIASAAHAGSYTTVGQNACTSCHMPHNANGRVRLLRPASPSITGVDATTQDCITCHNGGSNVAPAAPNVYAEFAKTAHPLPSGSNTHDAAEPVLLNNNRHATCVDCHNPHASNPITAFTAPPAIRPAQTGVSGVSGLDGITILTPAVNEYETCMRCHGSSIGKQTPLAFGYSPMRALAYAGDPLNLVPQFNSSATSSHPVAHDRSSTLPQPSLLTNMRNFDGSDSARLVGARIFCTDCHNSDTNREFGGQGPVGPHGSANSHILERKYVFAQAPTPGGLVTQTFPSPDLTSTGPYAMCAKCHNLSKVMANTSFSKHNSHVWQDGFSCSVCHTAHGNSSQSSSISGERLVNFDIKVVAPINGLPVSYNQGTQTCTLTCHQVAHNADGTVKSLSANPASLKVH